MKKIIALCTGAIILLACNINLSASPYVLPTPTNAPTNEIPIVEAAATFTAHVPPSITETFTPTFTSTPLPVPTATFVKQGPNKVVVPILMYHHISNSSESSRYNMSTENFEDQLKLLHNWGYATITTDLMVKALQEGAELPARPVILTFDDGNLDNYTTAFPIMQKYGYTGVLYIVANYVGADGFMNADQIKEMAAAGWEVGSHTISHKDLLALDPEESIREIVDSKHILENMLGVPVKTFAYPFASFTEGTVDHVRLAGYTCAMGSSYQNEHSIDGLFQLHRREIKGTYDLKNFTLFLPWQGDSVFLPADTQTPEE